MTGVQTCALPIFQILIRRCETDIPAEALKLLDKLTEAGAAGLAVCAANDPSITARISALADEGIPCVTFNSDLPDSRRLCFVGQDIYKAGRVAGGLMSRCIPAARAFCARRQMDSSTSSRAVIMRSASSSMMMTICGST
mgnify:CR=1 FL=1